MERSLFVLSFMIINSVHAAQIPALLSARASIADRLGDAPQCGIPGGATLDPFGLATQFVRPTTSPSTLPTTTSPVAKTTAKLAVPPTTTVSSKIKGLNLLLSAKDFFETTTMGTGQIGDSKFVAAGQQNNEIFLTGLGPDVNEVAEISANLTLRRQVIPRMLRALDTKVAQPLKLERTVTANQLCWQVKITVLVRASPGRIAYLTCGGTLVGSRTVLTAAHCLTNPFIANMNQAQKPEQVIVRIGDTSGDICTSSEDSNDCAEHFLVTKVTSHPEYNSVLGNNDIAILTLESPVDFEKKKCACSLCLRNKAPEIGHKCAVSGNGDELSVADRATSPFRWSVLDVLKADVSSADCGFNVDDANGNTTDLTNLICARGNKVQDSCQGDSGGPLVCMDPGKSSYYLAGVMAFGPPCGVNIGAMYTKISSYLPWIISNTGSDVQLT